MKYIDCLPLWIHGYWKLSPCHSPAWRANIISHITSPWKDQNSKFKAQFLQNACCFYTIIKLKNHYWHAYLKRTNREKKRKKMKNHKSNHTKPRTICLSLLLLDPEVNSCWKRNHFLPLNWLYFCNSHLTDGFLLLILSEVYCFLSRLSSIPYIFISE